MLKTLAAMILSVMAASSCLAGEKANPPREAPTLQVKWNPMLEVFPECLGVDVCLLRGSPGGIVSSFYAAAEYAKERGTRFVLEGICGSACVLFADMVRDRLCVLPTAEMWVHKIRAVGMDEGPSAPPKMYLKFQFSPELEKLVDEKGGQPANPPLRLKGKDLLRVWRAC